jgi:signal transduction histidine kinase/CheY-like chemotaxis protein
VKVHRIGGPADAYPFPTLAAPLRFAIATLLVGSVFGLDAWAGDLLDDAGRMILLGIAVVASAWVAGTGPALAGTVLAALLGAQLTMGQTGATSVQLALFVAQGLLLTGVVAELRRARREAEERAREAREAQQEGESASRMKDEFLATISHELRTPLNAVLGWVHLLRTGKLDASTAERGLESIDRNVRLQAQLTSDLLDVSKALTGKLRLDPRPSLLDEAARQALAAVTPAANAKGVRINASFPETPVTVHGDPTRLRQIAWQLLANAIKFTPRDGVVEITVDAFGQDARLIVRDSGSGIAAEFLPRIFDRFTQADASPTRKAGGLGVGLALVRELVELHGGEIDAHNRADGGGAIFIVRFPLQAVALEPRAAAAETLAPGTAPFLEGLRVLVLDQHPEGRELLGAVLEQRGAIVRMVASVAEALDALEEWRPDILVSDSLTPEHDSYALVGKVQSLETERGGRIPALALTSVARTDERLRDILAGAHRDVPKPVEPGVLTTEIARLAGRERRRAQR